MKLKYYILCLVSVLFSFQVTAQYYFYNDKYYDKDLITDIGIGLGGMNALTDLGANAGVLRTVRPEASVYAGLMYRDIVGLRLEVTRGKVGSADSLNKNPRSWSRLRNLSFTSPISEISLIAEFDPLMLHYYPDGVPPVSPYLLAGLGWFSFNPQTYYQGRWVDLQPLHTEGEGFAEYKHRPNYHLSQVNIPIGGGLKYELSELVTLRLELIYRFLFTDYLDDVSTTYIDPSLFAKYLSPANAALAKALYSRRGEVDPGYHTPIGAYRGNPRQNDAYYTFSLKLEINLGRTPR